MWKAGDPWLKGHFFADLRLKTETDSVVKCMRGRSVWENVATVLSVCVPSCYTEDTVPIGKAWQSGCQLRVGDLLLFKTLVWVETPLM